MARLDEIINAGYSPSPSGKRPDDVSFGQQFLGTALNSLTQGIQKANDPAQDMEQVKYYAALRDQGYSKEEAAEKVNKTYNSGFIPKALGKAFNSPTSDPYQAASEKAKADLGLVKAKSKYYNEGGSKRTVIDKMTPNQLQARLKFLADPILNPGGNEDPETQDEMAFISKKLQEISGFTPNQAAGAGNPSSSFSGQDESLIQANMQRYKKSREEVVAALRSKGYLNGQ